MNPLTKEKLTNITPQEAIELLKAGNERFVNKQNKNYNLLEQVEETAGGQNPFAYVLGCIDSRVPAEKVFDLGIGHIFNGRVAGNVVNGDQLGSMEFACKVTGSKVIVVLGHTSCGAVKGACDHVELGNLTGLLDKLQPAVEKTETAGERNSSNKDFVNAVVRTNVQLTIENIKEQSPILKEMADSNEIEIVGAVYNVENGRVEFL